MVSLTSLWLPILLSAVAVFFVSFVTHMLLKYHFTDFARLPGEEDVVAVFARHSVAPGDYMFPHAATPAAANDAAFMERRNRNPAGIVTVLPTPATRLTKHLMEWFIFSLVISLFCAYLAGRALPVAAAGAEVFRFTATVAFLGYGMALAHDSIWYGRKWSTTLKSMFDALLYGAATAGLFVWLWPR